MPPTKRPMIIKSASASGIKRRRTGGSVRVSTSSKGVGGGSAAARSPSASSSSPASKSNPLYDEFIQLLSHPDYKGKGIANSALKAHFGEERYPNLVPIINELTRASRLTMAKGTTRTGESEVYFSILSAEEATRLQGLDAPSKMVYQVIEASGDKGIWTGDIKNHTGIQQATLTKIFKALETRKLIKPIKAVTANNKKRYMLYDLTPSKEITGGPWYSGSEFDHEFIAELRNFILMCVRRMNGGLGVGNGVTLKQIANKMIQANVSRVQLSLEEVQQLVQTLAFDYLIDQRGVTENGEAMFVAAKPVTTMCEFGWWDALSPDFHFRGIRFEDDVFLSAHEPHHHS